MGFLSDLSDEIFGSESEVESKQQPTLSPEQLRLLQQLLGQSGANPDLASLSQGTQPFGGKMAPDLSRLENTSLAALEQMALQAASPGGDPSISGARETLGRHMEEDTFDEAAFDEYFGEAVAAPMLDMFKRDVLPEMTRRFSGSAAFGSDRMTAERGATQDFMKTLTGERAGQAFKTSQAGKDRSLQAAGMVPGVVGAQGNQLMQLMQAGAVPREVEGTKLSMDYQEFLRQQESKRKAYDRALALLGIQPHENTNIVKPGQPGLLQGVAGGVGAGVGKWLMA